MLFIYFYDAVYKLGNPHFAYMKRQFKISGLLSNRKRAGSHFIHVVEGLNCQDYARNVVCKTFFALLT